MASISVAKEQVGFILREGGDEASASSRAGGAIRKGGEAIAHAGCCRKSDIQDVQLFQLDQLVQLFRQFFKRCDQQKGVLCLARKSAVRFKDGQLGQDGQLGTHIFYGGVQICVQHCLCSFRINEFSPASRRLVAIR